VGADPWRPQPPAGSSAGQQAAAPAGQQGAAPAGQQTAAPTGQYGLPAGQFGPPTAGPYGYQPYDTPALPRTNRTAIAALVCGIAQFFLGLFAVNFLLAIPAVICGAFGMRQTRERGEGGRGLAVAGLVLGILGIVWNVLYVVLIIYLGAHFRPDTGPPPGIP
jgi:hypothetical protein